MSVSGAVDDAVSAPKHDAASVHVDLPTYVGLVESIQEVIGRWQVTRPVAAAWIERVPPDLLASAATLSQVHALEALLARIEAVLAMAEAMVATLPIRSDTVEGEDRCGPHRLNGGDGKNG
jgi:hypothetical protein